MSSVSRRNSRRLKLLRRRGVPIDGDHRVDQEWLLRALDPDQPPIGGFGIRRSAHDLRTAHVHPSDLLRLPYVPRA